MRGEDTTAAIEVAMIAVIEVITTSATGAGTTAATGAGMTAATETGMTAETEAGTTAETVAVTMMTVKETATAQREVGRTAIIDETAQTGGTVQSRGAAQTIGEHLGKILTRTGMTIAGAIGATSCLESKLAERERQHFFLSGIPKP